jgi:hypothetical protein
MLRMEALMPDRSSGVLPTILKGGVYRCCANRQGAAACNWLVKVDASSAGASVLSDTPCLACRLNRNMFDVSQPRNWHRPRTEAARRRLLTQLLALRLQVEARTSQRKGITFDMLEQLPTGKPILTGHHDGVATLKRRRQTTHSGKPFALRCMSPTERCWGISGTRSAITTGTGWCATTSTC